MDDTETASAHSPAVDFKRLFVALALLSIALGIAAAELHAWTCDDAFISVRYARHLVAGEGLVFNPGERVEGYTNLSWTLLIALGLALGAGVDTWIVQLGVLSFAVTLGLLAFGRWRFRKGRPRMALPLAVLVTAAHHDAAVFATSGLETSCLTACVLAGYLLLERDLWREGPLGWPAGLVLGLAITLRPDAAIFVAAGVVAFAFMRQWRALGRYSVGVLAIAGPLVAWRWSYYGDLLPNTYYAKSAATPWWTQGLHYLGLYLEQYGALFLGLLLVVVLAFRRGIDRSPWWAFTFALCGGVLLYTTAIVRAGGDFMFARLFVPLTPLLALLLERTVAALLPRRVAIHVLIAAVVVGTMQLLPRPVSGGAWRYGVADEWEFYDPYADWNARRQATSLARAVAGVDVRIGFLGGTARVVDDARMAYAQDAETGLTDAGMARRVLDKRGRPGHEKRASVQDLLDRQIDFVIGVDAAKVLRIADSLPVIPVAFGELEGVLVRWNPQVIDALRRQGAEIQDFPTELDGVIARLPLLSDAQVRSIEGRVRRFYFAFADDPVREAAFEARLRAQDVNLP